MSEALTSESGRPEVFALLDVPQIFPVGKQPSVCFAYRFLVRRPDGSMYLCTSKGTSAPHTEVQRFHIPGILERERDLSSHLINSVKLPAPVPFEEDHIALLVRSTAPWVPPDELRHAPYSPSMGYYFCYWSKADVLEFGRKWGTFIVDMQQALLEKENNPRGSTWETLLKYQNEFATIANVMRLFT